ncbi:MAG TPA: hypothetical protein VEV43_03750 [Actinomycetota bacterium]|nr:hypothetical protein [Actinomycetota bacterium]
MDSIFVEGVAATVSSIIVFCGSVWLLLALVLGPRLSYFITASVTLGFLLMMGVVWSVGEPLGPVGELPSYSQVGVGDTPAESGFGPAGDFPDGGGWFTPNPEEAAHAEIKSGAEGEAPDLLAEAIDAGEITSFEQPDQAQVDADSTQLLEQDGTFYAAVRFEPVPSDPEEEDAASDQDIAPEEGDGPAEDDAAAQEEELDPNTEAYVFLEQDPGDPSGQARMITLGFFVLLVLHLMGLSASERRAKRARAETS